MVEKTRNRISFFAIIADAPLTQAVMCEYYISTSKIHGFGVCSTKYIPANYMIGVAFRKVDSAGIFDIDWCTLELGRYVNHFNSPNLSFVFLIILYIM